MPFRAVSAVLFAALAFAGCSSPTGGAIKHDELERGVLTLGNTAGAGQLLTVGVIQDRTKTTLVRVTSGDLSDEATHEAEKLQDAESNPDLTKTKAQAVVIGQQIADALGDLQVAPKDPSVARAVGRRLAVLEHRANQLAAQI